MKARKSQKPLKKPAKAAPTKGAAAKKKMRLVKPATKTKPGTTKAAAAPAPAPAKRGKGREAAPKRQLEVVKRKAPKGKQREEQARAAEAEPEVALPEEELETEESVATEPAGEIEPIQELEEVEDVEEVEELEELDDVESDTPLISDISEIRARTGEDEEAPSLDELGLEGPEGPAPATRTHLKRVVESLIFVSDQPVTPNQLGRLVKAKQAEVREVVLEIQQDYEGRGIELIEVGGGYQFRSAAASAPFVRDMVAQRPVRLTRAQLETLALIAYRQPITRPEIDDVRGVDSGSAIKVLLDRDLVKILGRKDEAGRPLLYGTTPQFLDFFGMKNLQDLPTLREFTELSEENRELFKAKMGEIPDLSDPAYNPSAAHSEEPLDEDELAARGEPGADESAAADGEQIVPSETETETETDSEAEARQEEVPSGEEEEGAVEDREEGEADEDEDDESDDDEDAELDPEAEAEAEAEIDAEMADEDEEGDEDEDDESDEDEDEDEERDEDEDEEGDEDEDDEAVAHSDDEADEDEERDEDEDEERDADDDDDEESEDEELEDDEPVAEADPSDDEGAEDEDQDEDSDEERDDDEDEDSVDDEEQGYADEERDHDDDEDEDSDDDDDPEERA